VRQVKVQCRLVIGVKVSERLLHVGVLEVPFVSGEEF